MSDQKDRNTGQWHNPLLKNEERERIEKELTEEEITEYAKIWEASGKFSPPAGLSLNERVTMLEDQVDNEVVIVPMYRSKSFKSAVGAFVAASVLFSLLYFLKPQNIAYDQQYLTEAGDRIEVILPDGSVVQLNASSELKFSSENWEKERGVSLVGEAFFEVQKSTVPFIVRSGSMNVTVLGTSFNIKNRNSQNQVSCLSGKVSVDSDGNGEVILTKGLATMVVNGSLPKQPYETDIEQIDSWVDGKFYFQETPLSEVFQEVERQFGVIIASDLDFTTQNFNGYFVDDDLHKSLTIICLSAGLQFNVNGSKIEIFN